MKILEVLTYYRPHISGLTIYAERLCRALARQGHEVTVLTSHYDHELPGKEWQDGVNVVRVPVAFRISKGVIMPTFGFLAWKYVRQADIIHLHLPQFDAPGVALRGRLLGKPVVLTYHSDLRLPDGLFNRLVDRVVHSMNRLAGTLAGAVVTYTRDFGSHSPYLSSYLGKKLYIIPPPVELVEATAADVAGFQARHNLAGRRVIGISARIAAEKGIEVLLKALPAIRERFPDAHVLHANPDTLGEDAYLARLKPLFEAHQEHYHLLGALRGPELTAFYRSLDCLVLCSLNNTETFGLVQVEAMINGAPVVASDLPGVRQPVTMTGMGEVVPVGDYQALAQAVIRVLSHRDAYTCPPEIITRSFSPDQTAAEYIRLFNNLRQGKKDSSAPEPAAYERLRHMKDSMA
ncbi:MAG: glycosyltransferase family 4 protein [Chloroflexi bacterium]|nr:glycosyltransferase family 4 protein [Chloroflexota bacterium]MCI0578687.1 glycosyltransferase family 4 protein [Chloroflexota bacterium]MCI0648347.1 glycosyltransferase family 4 protein [Chloroflexota bacterium]MCI0729675.1 glycosyltransferase family 4 protein [Chloroflexota bacterium]